MSNILIAGLHKTGTTGLYNALKSAVPAEDGHFFLFEPKDPQPLLALGRYAPHNPIVAKILVNRLNDCAVRYSDFDRRVMLVRDPRDIAVSRLLFRPMYGWTSYHLDVKTLDPFIEALQEKEADPASHSVKGLHDLADELGIGKAGWPQLGREMTQKMRLLQERDFCVVRYEDFVDNRLDNVSRYLDLPISNPQATDKGWTSHIQRSMGYGGWKHWFLDEDVEFFGELFADYLARFGYDNDWKRAAEPHIDPATSSGHIAGKTRERIIERQNREKKSWTIDQVRTADELRQLTSMAEDGRATWAYRLALIHSEGQVFVRDPSEALRWARHAAHHGHAPAMVLTARFLSEQARGDANADTNVVAEAHFWQREHDRLAGHQRETAKSGKSRGQKGRKAENGQQGAQPRGNGAPTKPAKASNGTQKPASAREGARLQGFRGWLRYEAGPRLPQWSRGPAVRVMSALRRADRALRSSRSHP